MIEELLFSGTGILILAATIILIGMKIWLYRWLKRKTGSGTQADT